MENKNKNISAQRSGYLQSISNKQSGFLKLIILIIIALALLKLVWGLELSDLFNFLNRPHIREIWEAFLNFWKLLWEFIKSLF